MSKVLAVRIKESGSYGRGCYEYKNEITLEDYKKLALILIDLDSFDANIEKAFREFKRLKEEGFPF